jgi:hypothetical protein
MKAEFANCKILAAIPTSFAVDRFDGAVKIGSGLISRVRVGKFLHGANDLCHPARTVQTLVDGPRHFGDNEIQVAVALGLLQSRSHRKRQQPGRISHGAAVVFEQFMGSNLFVKQ